MTYFTLEALPARHGDCLMLHYGTDADPGLILIDGGPSKVWKGALLPRLAALQARRGDQFKIDMLMISHIDEDHIQGILDFTSAWRNADADGEAWPFPVREMWHNSFERVAGDPDKVTASILASTGAPALPDVELEPDEDEDEEAAQKRLDAAKAALKVLASVGQGAQLRKDSDVLEIPRNTGFDGLVRPEAGPEVPYEVGAEMTFEVVGPLEEQIDALQKKFAADLPPLEALAAYTDESVANLSSIVVLARCKSRTMLLTGDARGDFILDGLRAAELLDANGKLHVDLLKMQHHGSDRNTKIEFFRDVTADHYVVSADGRHGNPDRATFEMLVEGRGKDAIYTIYLTYSVASIDALRKEEWVKDRESKIERAKTKPKTKVPREWDSKKDDISAFLSSKKSEGFAFEVIEPSAAATWPRIDLLDPIDF